MRRRHDQRQKSDLILVRMHVAVLPHRVGDAPIQQHRKSRSQEERSRGRAFGFADSCAVVVILELQMIKAQDC